MNFNEMISNVLYIVLTAIVPIVTAYVVNLMKAQIEKCAIVTELTKNENLTEVINGALCNIADSVMYVNQVYVDALKRENKFTAQSQRDALKLAYNEAIKLISDEAKNIIENTYGSFEDWLYLQIEVAVKNAKK